MEVQAREAMVEEARKEKNEGQSIPRFGLS